MTFFCIADEDTVRGFRLAGVEGLAVAGEGDAAEALARAAARPDCGIVILTEDVAAALHAQLDAFRLEHPRPLLVVIPGPSGPRRERRTLGEIAREAIGISVDQESVA